jgi:hypothetical protein
MTEVFDPDISAMCSYCAEMAVFRIGNTDYELHACWQHFTLAHNEMDAICGIEAWRLVTNSPVGFPKPNFIQS